MFNNTDTPRSSSRHPGDDELEQRFKCLQVRTGCDQHVKRRDFADSKETDFGRLVQNWRTERRMIPCGNDIYTPDCSLQFHVNSSSSSSCMSLVDGKLQKAQLFIGNISKTVKTSTRDLCSKSDTSLGTLETRYNHNDQYKKDSVDSNVVIGLPRESGVSIARNAELFSAIPEGRSYELNILPMRSQTRGW